MKPTFLTENWLLICRSFVFVLGKGFIPVLNIMGEWGKKYMEKKQKELN